MSLFREGDLEFDFRKATSSRRFDDESHGLTHCMCAVDFIVELPDRILFVEAKDPQNPSARPAAIQNFIGELESGSLIQKKLVPKCRDSYLYELSMGRLGKPVYYIVLVVLSALTKADLAHQSDLLNKYIPVEGPPENHWKDRFIQDSMIMDLEAWGKHFPRFPVRRLSELPNSETH
ncbi:MAG: hypothetical protein JW941_00135 [Candidatus Coatesbacteria bacterium]|nr:hypothetical protein [Candidatus Coatesbacteria bacterium]